MKCDHCIALRNDSGYERDATEWWCAVGEEEKEFADGSVGCNRKSIQKLKRDIVTEDKIEERAFVKECRNFLEYVDQLKV